MRKKIMIGMLVIFGVVLTFAVSTSVDKENIIKYS